MAEPQDAVKPRRPYDASRRRQQAHRSRDRIIEVAQRRFLAEGYANTSVGALARDAHVSVDTVYKAFGGKPGLVRAIYRRALEGEGPIPAELRSDRLQADEADPERIIEGWSHFVTEIAPRTTPIFLLLRTAAATDPELGPLLDEIHADRLRRMSTNARRLYEAGHLRGELTIADAADVLWTYSSPELYELLVLRRGMSLRRYGAFVARAMASALLPLSLRTKSDEEG
jgi:AcrR family transcriptional regulator